MKVKRFILPWVSIVFLIGWQISVNAQGWHQTIIEKLPDTSFALIEETPTGKLRHCPHHDINGVLDEEQLIYVLGTLDRETWSDNNQLTIAKKHLEAHYIKYRNEAKKKGIPETVNINKASLTQLVSLPQIGPVLAVKIVEYRKQKKFESIEEIKKVEGIGEGTFHSIRHYLTIE